MLTCGQCAKWVFVRPKVRGDGRFVAAGHCPKGRRVDQDKACAEIEPKPPAEEDEPNEP